MDLDEDILAGFMEDTREHLAGIEESLMDMEQAGDSADPGLVNTVFRAAHSIKGGASFLGLNKARDLAHRLENILHMMRSGEMSPSRETISPLLAGFDLLRSVVDLGLAGNGQDISQVLGGLSRLAESHLPGEENLLEQAVSVPVRPGGPSFSVDKLTLSQALAGGKNLYLVEYDLIHDVHARGKTPLDVISVMESSGLILDCMMDLAAVGVLDGPPSNRIPFHILFATIVEPEVAGYLFMLDSSRIRHLDPASLEDGGFEPTTPARVVALEGDADTPRLEKLKDALLDAMTDGHAVAVDLSQAGEVGAAFVQFAYAANISAARMGSPLSLVRIPPRVLARLDSLGAGPGLPGMPPMEAGPMAEGETNA